MFFATFIQSSNQINKKVLNKEDYLNRVSLYIKFSKLTSVFHASVLILIMCFVITLSK